MMIHLPDDLERSIRAQVANGLFVSMDEAMTEAARLLLREVDSGRRPPVALDGESPDPILGCMRDDAELMDEIVADTYRQRAGETWREIDL